MTTDHAARATDLLATAAGQSLTAAALTVAEAQTHALLVIAHEQRIANLLTAYCGEYGYRMPETLIEPTKRAIRDYLTAATETRETT